MLAYTLAFKPCSEATNREYLVSMELCRAENQVDKYSFEKI